MQQKRGKICEMSQVFLASRISLAMSGERRFLPSFLPHYNRVQKNIRASHNTIERPALHHV